MTPDDPKFSDRIQHEHILNAALGGAGCLTFVFMLPLLIVFGIVVWAIVSAFLA